MVTFLAADSSVANAHHVIAGIPDDQSVSYRRGARLGPAAIREASHAIEAYSPYQHLDLSDLRIADAGDFLSSDNDFNKLAAHCRQNRIPLYTIGGDHSITYLPVEIMCKNGGPVDLVQLDAHCDLRPAYEGNPKSHASIMYRCGQLANIREIHQLGVRSGTREEFSQANIYSLNDKGLSKLSGALRSPVYLTIDIDVFDPAYVPGTGTPETNGWCFSDFLLVWRLLSSYDLIGIDLVETAPNLDVSGRTSIFAATVLRELLLYRQGNA